MALNRSLVGKTYPPVVTEIDTDALQKYARAYGDDNPLYFAPTTGGIIAPPMYHTVVTWLALITVIGDPELRVDLLRLLHKRQEMEFLAPIRSGDQITACASIVSIEGGAQGETITIYLEASNQRQQPVSRSRFTALIRGRRDRDATVPLRPSAPEMPSREPLLRVSQKIDLDQTYRYAEASGDRNPIHLDENVARLAGLPGIIVHGLCTMALISKAIVNHLCDGSPLRLKRLTASFSRPVFPGDTITTVLYHETDSAGNRSFTFETYNGERSAVIREGRAVVSL
jgi:acyl dehydratase